MVLKGIKDMELLKFPENSDEKLELLKTRIESFFSTKHFEKPRISSIQNDALEKLYKFKEVYFYTKTPIFRHPDEVDNYLTCQTFKISDIGKFFIFYYCTGEIIQGLFIECSEATIQNRENNIDKILD
jgi:hypothetical protein